MRMDLRLLEIFCRVYAQRSFSRAAKDLHLTQPTISAHVRELEDSIGAPLFNRLGRDIQPTEAGRHLYERAQEVVTLKRSIVESMATFLGRVEGVLTVGASSVPGECLLPRLMTGFHTMHPAVRSRLRISDSGDTLDDVRHGEVELAMVGSSASDKDLLFEPFTSDTLVLAVPATTSWKNKPRVTLRQLRDLPLLVRESGSGTRMALETALTAKKLTLDSLNVAAELGSLGAIKEAVRQGYGVSFLSEIAIRPEVAAGLLRTARVDGLGTIRRTYYTVVHGRHALSPLTRAFLEYVRSAPE
jgi:DNA-binding transcriptional LysR family regulator